MTVGWTDQAEKDLTGILRYIGFDDPGAASRLNAAIQSSVEKLAAHPFLGRAGAIEGTRELIPHRSYRIVYQVDDGSVLILAVVHTSRRWPPLHDHDET